MPKQSLASIAKSVRTAMKKHSPEILTGIGIAGMITTTVMAVKATPKALILLEEKKEELDTDRLEAKDIIKTAWPCYIPAAVVGSISVFCLIGASSTNLRRNAALATAYIGTITIKAEIECVPALLVIDAIRLTMMIKPCVSFQQLKRKVSRYDKYDEKRVYQKLVSLYTAKGGKSHGVKLQICREHSPTDCT